jgi:long-subunit acyl-CoA synthetase (AMP-forming)
VLEIKGDLLFKTCLSHNKTEVIDKNAWYSTNDAIRVKKNRLIIIGRQDDAIIGSDGNNVYPETIENLYNTTSLYTVGIVGIKQRSGYHRISLLVKFNKTISDDVKQRVIHNILKITEQIPISRRPARFFEVNNIPLTELGKVKHHELTTLYEHNKIELSPISTNSIVRQEQSEKIDPELLKKIRQCFANVFKIKIEEVQNDTNFITDLGGSSLDYYSILNEIQHVTGKEIKLVGEKILLTPNDFAIYLMR